MNERFLNKVANFKEKYDYPNDREEYASRMPPKPGNIIKDTLGGAGIGGCIGAVGLGLPASLVGKGYAGAAIGSIVGSGIGAVSGFHMNRDLAKDYRLSKLDPLAYRNKEIKDFNTRILPDLQSEEDFYVKYIGKHPAATKDHIGINARKRFRLADENTRQDMLNEADSVMLEDPIEKLSFLAAAANSMRSAASSLSGKAVGSAAKDVGINSTIAVGGAAYNQTENKSPSLEAEE